MHIIPGGSGRVRERGNDEEEEEIIIIMLACRFQFKDGMGDEEENSYLLHGK